MYLSVSCIFLNKTVNREFCDKQNHSQPVLIQISACFLKALGIHVPPLCRVGGLKGVDGLCFFHPFLML
jgi:hypothetical protein